MTEERPESKAKPPSELSLEAFATLVDADESLPEALRTVVRNNIENGSEALLGAINLAVGEIGEN